MRLQNEKVAIITAAVDETARAAEAMSSAIDIIHQGTSVVVIDIEKVSLGLDEIGRVLVGLRQGSVEYARGFE